MSQSFAPETRRLEARAEADAVFMKLDTEARRQYEILAKKGEGLKWTGDRPPRRIGVAT